MRGTIAVIGIVLLLVLVAHQNRERSFADENPEVVAGSSSCPPGGWSCQAADPCHADGARFAVVDDSSDADPNP